MKLPETRAEAKAIGSKHYFTGKPCTRGHIAPRFTSIGKCKTCAVEDSSNSYTPTTDRRRAYDDLAGFIVKANQVHNGFYTYELAEYVNAHAKLKVTCPTHGVFDINPTNHVQGKGCPICAIQRTRAAQIKSTDTFIKHAIAVWGNAFDYSGVVYEGAKEPIAIRCIEHNRVFMQQPNNHLEKKNPCTQCNHMKSEPENQIAAFLEQYTTVERWNRTLIKPKEIDIWLPEYGIGVEFHGLYAHRAKVAKTLHRDKWELAEKAGIRLIQIFHDEWENKQDIVKARLLAFIGKSVTYNARQLTLRQVSMSEIRPMLEATHIQGAGVSSVNYALYEGEKVVAVATFGKARSGAMTGAKAEGVWEVVRYASVGRVRGGFSKLFKQFLKDINPSKVISYCDLRYGNGKLYEATGFELEAITETDYWWIPKGKLARVPRYVTQKHKMAKPSHPLHKFYSPDKTEAQICEEAKWEKIYGVGNQRWVWTKQTTCNPTT